MPSRRLGHCGTQRYQRIFEGVVIALLTHDHSRIAECCLQKCGVIAIQRAGRQVIQRQQMIKLSRDFANVHPVDFSR